MKKAMAGMFLAAVVFVPAISFADTATSTSNSRSGVNLTACYFLLKMGAQWCDNSLPEVQNLWAQPEIRDAFRSLYVSTL